MFAALTSLLFLGIVQPLTPQKVRTLPGVELLSIAPPARLTSSAFKLPRLSASGAILIDGLSGEELRSINPDQKRPTASLAKIMTALLILENHRLDEIVTISEIAETVRGSSVGLKPGQHFSVGALLKAILIPSANDAAYALAVFHSRSIPAFAQAMNDRALTLGLKNTHFSNPAGLDNGEQYSTPRDMAWLTMSALRNPAFRKTVGTRSAKIFSEEGREIDIRNTNELLHYNPDVFGVKTGTTDAAKECLVVLFNIRNHPYLLVLLGSQDRYTDSLYVLQAMNAAK
ncbi:hypothetical protein A3A67_04175 [Candidatus Peribacteria bacterium RIFCSPLOWO2_01_FULL_51_18]|nr:MAG: hypothetical protein A3C52_04055 [Candidatus Peribacteria bacterium RIFCSPHIGHO2_02_FULL_51_15]OGJ65827.1 MAG: hypothetical protein A3A67_04175 [Candidatus Peribacteria bacterium RIFCSPLOWO2_01_FULL_51_18]OGJ68446.1 MAG: hypothetical protein A3J34_04640 [Candidatus Peribacteria bacterium RIFCSPLOWO2_02_FULL_51_10]